MIRLNHKSRKRTPTGLKKGKLVTAYILSNESQIMTVFLECCSYLIFNYIVLHSQSHRERNSKGITILYILRKHINIERGTIYNEFSSTPVENPSPWSGNSNRANAVI